MDQQASSIPIEAGETSMPSAVGSGKRNSDKRVAFASLIGGLIEGYDFVIYATAAALVFPYVFFPALGGAQGIVASLATLGIAFVARPFGSVLFGHFGDRLGRKNTLIATLFMMGTATVLIGCLPTASTIGVAAPIALVVLRALQGLAVGGEWAGANLFVAEHAPVGKRGMWAAFPQLGHALPTAMSSATFLIIGLSISGDAFLNWGWRLPFLFSAVLVMVGLWVRIGMEETPVFEEEKKLTDLTVEPAPFVEALKTQPKQIALGAGVALMALSFVYVSNSYLANYGTATLGLARNFVLTVGIGAGLLYAATVVISAVLSDRIGRRPILGCASVIATIWALLLFPVIDGATELSYAVAICVTLAIAGFGYGAVGAFLPEQFETRYRYTASGLSYNLTGVLAGGVTPLIAPVIVTSSGPLAFGCVLAGICALSAFCTFKLKESSDVELRDVS